MGSYHWYCKDGLPHHDEDLRTARANDRYGSVTTVLGAWGKNPNLQKWIDRKNCNLAIELYEHGEPRDYCADRALEIAGEELDKTSRWGTAVHDRVEKYNFDRTITEDDYKPFWDSWIDWDARHVKKVLHPERTFVNHDDKLAGTVDLVFEHNDLGICVGDYKNREFKLDKRSNKIKCGWYDKDFQQLSYYAYMVMIELGLEMMPPIFSFGFDSKVPRQMAVKQWPSKKQQSSVDFVQFINLAWRIEKNLD